MPDALWVVVGAAVGAPLRYLAGRLWNGGAFPWGTLAVNVAGSFTLGAIVSGDLAPWLVTALGTGFCGALTTYSAFGYETVDLALGGRWRAGLLNVGLNVVAGLGAAALGTAL